RGQRQTPRIAPPRSAQRPRLFRPPGRITVNMVLSLTMAVARDDDARELAHGLRTRNPELLVGKYQYRLLRYLVALTANPILAEDLFQETWLRVLERGRQYKPEYRFESWLFTIARNLFLDRVRRKPEVGL